MPNTMLVLVFSVGVESGKTKEMEGSLESELLYERTLFITCNSQDCATLKSYRSKLHKESLTNQRRPKEGNFVWALLGRGWDFIQRNRRNRRALCVSSENNFLILNEAIEILYFVIGTSCCGKFVFFGSTKCSFYYQSKALRNNPFPCSQPKLVHMT